MTTTTNACIWSHQGPPTLADRAILQCIANAGGPTPSMEELELATALSAKVIRLHLAGLLRAGWLSRAGQAYRLNVPPERVYGQRGAG